MSGEEDKHPKSAPHTSVQKFIANLTKEKQRLPEDFPLCASVIDDAIARAYETGRKPGKEFKADVYQQKPLRLQQNVYLPVDEYPKFHFHFKFADPNVRGLRELKSDTQCEIILKGRRSMRDATEEDTLRKSGDLRYKHLNRKLYLEISTIAPPAEAYARIAKALREVRKYAMSELGTTMSLQDNLEYIAKYEEDVAQLDVKPNIAV